MKKSMLLLKSGLYLFACWLASFVIVMFFPASYQKFGSLMCFVFGICSVGACVCIYGDFAWKLGGKMRLADERAGTTDNHNFGLYLGLVPTIINYIYVFILYLSKFGVIKYDFYPLYKTLTFYFMPWTYLFAPNTLQNINGVMTSVNAKAWEISALGMIIITLLPLIFLGSAYVAFKIGYNHIDVKEKILYGK